MKQILNYLPGFSLALLIAFIARGIERVLPFPFIGASVIALFIGMAANYLLKPNEKIIAGLKLLQKKY